MSTCFQIVLLGRFLRPLTFTGITHFLENTGKRLLVEASPTDTLFGSGQGLSSKTINNPSTHTGKNLQGKMLERIRGTMFQEEEVEDMTGIQEF